MNKFDSIEIRLATEEDKHLPTFDNTKLVALDTCVRYGIIRYQMHKNWEGSTKPHALTAGSAMHDIFAAVRLWQLFWYDLADCEYKEEVLKHQMIRLFGEERGLSYINYFEKNTREDLIALCLALLYSSNYQEDPEDKKRTFSALEESAINYINRWDFKRYPIWVRDKNDPNTDVGIELPFDLVITFSYYTGEYALAGGNPDSIYDVQEIKSYRFTGRLDGLHIDPQATNPDLTKGALFLDENKTTSRIMENWGDQYEMSTQPTGYMIAAKYLTLEPVYEGRIILLSVPVPSKSVHGGYSMHRLTRQEYEFDRWFNWFYELAQVEHQNKDNPFDAPVSPHSCFRYFRPCSMLPFCKASNEEQREALEEMVEDKWDVLDEAS